MADPHDQPDEHEAFEADFADLLDGTLSAARKQEVEGHLAACPRCRGELDKAKGAMSALSGLHKITTDKLEDKVAETIYRRSAGRFFGRKAFGDRVPFELIAVVGLLVALAVVVLLKVSLSGSLHDSLERHERAPDAGAAAREVMPRP